VISYGVISEDLNLINKSETISQNCFNFFGPDLIFNMPQFFERDKIGTLNILIRKFMASMSDLSITFSERATFFNDLMNF